MEALKIKQTSNNKFLSKPRQAAFTFRQVRKVKISRVNGFHTNKSITLQSFSVDMPKNMTMDSRLEYRFGQSGGNHSSPSSHSPTKESLKNSERYLAQSEFSHKDMSYQAFILFSGAHCNTPRQTRPSFQSGTI